MAGGLEERRVTPNTVVSDNGSIEVGGYVLKNWDLRANGVINMTQVLIYSSNIGAQHVSGLRITHVLGDITTVIPKRKKPKAAREAFQTKGADDSFELVDIKVEDASGNPITGASGSVELSDGKSVKVMTDVKGEVHLTDVPVLNYERHLFGEDGRVEIDLRG